MTSAAFNYFDGDRSTTLPCLSKASAGPTTSAEARATLRRTRSPSSSSEGACREALRSIDSDEGVGNGTPPPASNRRARASDAAGPLSLSTRELNLRAKAESLQDQKWDALLRVETLEQRLCEQAQHTRFLVATVDRLKAEKRALQSRLSHADALASARGAEVDRLADMLAQVAVCAPSRAALGEAAHSGLYPSSILGAESAGADDGVGLAPPAAHVGGLCAAMLWNLSAADNGGASGCGRSAAGGTGGGTAGGSRTVSRGGSLGRSGGSGGSGSAAYASGGGGGGGTTTYGFASRGSSGRDGNGSGGSAQDMWPSFLQAGASGTTDRSCPASGPTSSVLHSRSSSVVSEDGEGRAALRHFRVPRDRDATAAASALSSGGNYSGEHLRVLMELEDLQTARVVAVADGSVGQHGSWSSGGLGRGAAVDPFEAAPRTY